MLGGTFFREFDDDPFFSRHRQHMQHMEQMMHPFDMRHNMLTSGAQPQPQPQPHHRHHSVQRSHGRHRHQHQQQQMAPLGMFGMDFGFGDMFRNMRTMMDDMNSSFGQIQTGQVGPNSHTFSQSSYVSYSNNGEGGRPNVYQSSSSVRQAPGGVKETRKTVRDSESGLEKISIGHHINDRSHIIERSRNQKTGDHDENQEYINIDQEEAPTFDNEWQDKTRHTHRESHHQRRHNPIGNPARSSHRVTPALPEPQRPRSRSHSQRE